MKYQELTDAYAKIEATTKRLEMTDLLVELLKKTPKELLPKMMYLTQGKLYPDFQGVEIGIADKLAIRAISEGTGKKAEDVTTLFNKVGDLGQTAYEIKLKSAHKNSGITIEEVYKTLDEIAGISGAGTVSAKLKKLADLIFKASAGEAKYLIRTATGKLRLGVADMTMLDALAIVFGGGKHTKEVLERAYNISSDLGTVAAAVAKGGLKGAEDFSVQVNRPIRPMLAERLSDPKEILEKMGGQTAVEFKYDGERLQVHKNGNEVELFSRRLEKTTHQYPDVIELVQKNVKAKSAIFEAEVVALNIETGELLPFQELMHRRRKHGITQAVQDYPIAMFCFDLLFVNGKDLTKSEYPVRRKKLEEIITLSDQLKLGESIVTKDAQELEAFFERAVAEGVEGVICKSVAKDSFYKAGARGWAWIKYKRDYKSEMTDTVDLVVIGGLHGRGRRAGTYGALLLASYDPKTDMFHSVTKCGSGFTDLDLAGFSKRLNPLKISHKHPRAESDMKADVWFIPGLVLEIIGAEITLSPIHKTAWEKVRKNAGLAIRFPRFTGKYRDDKAPEDATTDQEILEMYEGRVHKIR